MSSEKRANHAHAAAQKLLKSAWPAAELTFAPTARRNPNDSSFGGE
jgi:hypothetical protein